MIIRNLQSTIRNWINERIPIESIWHFLNKPVPKDLNFLFNFGSCALFLISIQIITGIFLTIYYVPTPDHAYDSIQYIQNQVMFGKFIRGLHHWSASLLVIMVVLHIIRVFVYGSYKKPRELTWSLGVGLLLLVLGFGFTGYLLPWDQKAYWATVVGTKIAGSAPVVGNFILRLIRGGQELGALTLSRFYAVHIIFLPAALMGLLSLHIYLIRKLGISGSWKRKKNTEENTIPFFPYQMVKDITGMLIIFIILILIVLKFPAPLERIADPTDLSYIPRPEWYFLFLYELLKFFPGKLEPIATIVIPTVAVFILLLLPFLDRKEDRNPLTRKLFIIPGLFAIIVIGILEYRGYVYKPIPPSPLVTAPLPAQPTSIEKSGEQLYTKLHCAYCHKINGVGGMIGPELTTVGSFRTGDWMISHFRNPQAVAPGFKMPVIELNEDELNALAAYMLRLRKEAGQEVKPATQDKKPASDLVTRGKQIYIDHNCATCHSLNGEGGKIGPALDGVGPKHKADWHKKHFKNPADIVPGSIMPATNISDADLDALIAYMLSLK
jgi:ubiquinol-cytochrome c reductase cytochrome b subunit